MKNVLDERPTTELHGGTAYARDFVAAPDYAQRDVLDIGCGFGWFELAAADRGVRSVVGVEPEEAALETARRHVALAQVTFRAASAVSLPFADESFDTVVMWEVLEHLQKRSEPLALREVARVLRPGGVLYLSTPHGSLRARLTDPAWWLIGHRHYAPERVAQLAADAALAVEVLESKAGAWQIAYIINLYVSKWLLRRPPLFREAFEQRLDGEWSRPFGYVHVFMRCRKRR